MHTVEHCRPAAEQLYDEILARAWSLHQLDPSLARDVHSAAVRAHAAETAVRIVSRIVQSPANEERRWLSVLLWSASAPPDTSDGWWLTPLGHLLRPLEFSPSHRHPSSSAA